MNILDVTGARVRAEYRAPEPVPFRVLFGRHLALAPAGDGVVLHPGQADTDVLHLYEGPGRLRRLPIPPFEREHLLGLVHLGDAVVAQFRRYPGSVRYSRTVRYRRAEDWAPELLRESDEYADAKLGAVPGGFVVGTLRAFHFGGAQGPVQTRTPDGWPGDDEAFLHATDPVSGRLAVTAGRGKELLLVEPDLTIAARMPIRDEQQRVDDAYFCGPDTILATGMWHGLRSIRAEHGRLRVTGGRHLDKEKRRWLTRMGSEGILPFPSLRRVCVEYDGEAPLWLDADSMDRVDAPPQYRRGLPLWLSADERRVVIETSRDRLELFDTVRLEIAELLHRPLDAFGPADLARIRRLRRLDPSPATADVLDLIAGTVAGA